MKLTRIYEVILPKRPPHLQPNLRIGRAMPPLPLHSVTSWHVICRSLNLTLTTETFVVDAVIYLGKFNIRGKCLNNTSTSVKNFEMEKEYLS